MDTKSSNENIYTYTWEHSFVVGLNINKHVESLFEITFYWNNIGPRPSVQDEYIRSWMWCARNLTSQKVQGLQNVFWSWGLIH